MNVKLMSMVIALTSTVVASAPSTALQIEQLPHADTTAGNFFGVAVAIDGMRALVGASGETSCRHDGGAAYVFEESERTRRWQRTARLAPSDCTDRRFFGRSVALSGDRALVASSNTEDLRHSPSAAYIFERDTDGLWYQAALLSVDASSKDRSANTTVALDGDWAILTTWGDPSHGQYGGAAYIFRYDNATQQWSRAVRLSGSGGTQHGIFGGKASISGSRLIVPSSNYLASTSGSVYIFEHLQGHEWTELTRISGIDDFFIAADIDGDRILVGESRAGRDRSGIATVHAPDAAEEWQQVAALAPPTPYRHGAFGSEVALSGDRALIVGYDEQLKLDFNINRVVYVYAFDPSTNVWAYQSIIDIGLVAFGSAVDLDGHRAVIGAASENMPGAAYMVRIP